MRRKLRIAVDFDGVIVSEKYPDVGVLMNGAKETITDWHNAGHTIIINTCRVGDHAANAASLLHKESIPFDYFNKNDVLLIEKYGADCRKISADYYLDDKNFGGFIGWEKAREFISEMENKKPLIIAMVGESGSGKTFWAEHIEREFGIAMIESWTDRAKRSENENGHTFVTREEFDSLKEEDMIAFTQFGDNRYCCLKKDVRAINTYVIDEFGLDMLYANYKNVYDIIAVRVHCKPETLDKRAGFERRARDVGKFNKPIELFDYSIDTDGHKGVTKAAVNRIIESIKS